ncbi:ionotropic receptor 93a-like [Teleopsis dalmanni]|uniref:ionotropic receptor 93a-like n=1 Tax=Teleopsis dalmanni TaxID=139649 RepID=UPI0018CE54CB|nr:ionotropic receptor 93a-like [Teleopsis dalmanni]
MKCFQLVSILVIAPILFGHSEANDFSSFLSANASLAVVVDQEYMQQRGENILASFQKILSDIIRENLKNGGINVKYFNWNAVRLKKDFLAAMTVTDCENTWKFYEATHLSSILLIAITDSDCPRLPLNRAIMIPIVNNGEEFSQILLDSKMQQILKWKTAVVLLDQTILTENTNLIKSVVLESSQSRIPPISVLLYTIDDTLRGQKRRQAIRNALAPFTYKPTENHHQFLIVSKFHDEIIEIADSMQMFHINNQWFFIILGDEQTYKSFDPAIVTQNLAEGTNIAFALNETDPSCVHSINCTIAELSMAFVTSISRMIHEEQSIYGEISDEEWESIRYTKQEKQDEILNYMKDYLKLKSSCTSCSRWRIITAITWGRTQEHYKFRPVTREGRNKNFEFINIGYWSPVNGFVTHELTFPHIQHYFRNITLDIVTMHNPPWQILKKDNKGAVVEHSGIVIEILKELSRMLNFTYHFYEVKRVDEDDLLYNNENNTLTGSLTHIIPYNVIDLMQGSRFFMAAVAATIDEPHKKPFNYTQPISVQRYSFILRRPDEVSRIYLFTAPFTLETWGCLLGAMALTIPVLYLINYFVPMEHLRMRGLCTLRNCFWYVYGALLQQGGMYLPKADSGRLVIGFWWLVVIVLVTTYCGNLVAFLTFPKFQPGVDYLFQLFKGKNIEQFGLRNGTLFEKYAATSVRTDFNRYMARAKIYSNPQDEDINAVKSGKRVNIDWRINLQLIVQNHLDKDKECKFALGKENFVDEQVGLIMPSNNPYLHLINEKITRLFQMGFIERWHQTNLPSMEKCNGKGVLRQITNHKVNLDDMQGCFLVLLLGFAISIFILFIEYWFYRLYVVDRENNRAIFTT